MTLNCYLNGSLRIYWPVGHHLVLHEIKSSFCYLFQENYDDPHKTPASPVVHIRGLIDGVVEADLVEALQEFGPIRYFTQKPKIELAENSAFGFLCIIGFWLEVGWPVGPGFFG